FNYVLSAGLDSGVAIAALVIFFALQNQETHFPAWWGNPAEGPVDQCPLATAAVEGANAYQVLLKVFGYLRNIHPEYPRDYHESHGLDVEDAAVSKTFYHYALAAKYNTLYFYITDYDEETYEETETATVHSNIKEVISRNLTHVPRMLLFTFGSFPSPTKIYEALEAEGFFSHQWRSVYKIRFYKDPSEDYREETYDSESLVRVNKALADALPNVVSLQYEVEGDWSYGRNFACDFIAEKASKLKTVGLFHTTLRNFSVRQFGQSLTTLKLNFDTISDEDYKALIYAPTITNLTLGSVHPRTFWDIFYSNGDGDGLEFSRLESLAIYFDPRAEEPFEPETRDTSKITFPRLTSLEVNHIQGDANQCLKIFPISRVRRLTVSDNNKHERLDLVPFVSLETLEMGFGDWCEFGSKVDFDEWTHPLFSLSLDIKHLHLLGFDPRFAPNLYLNQSDIVHVTVPDSVSLNSLESLRISALLKPGHLPKLLSQLPSLKSLVLFVSSSGSPNLLEAGFTAESAPAEFKPISRSITYLESIFDQAYDSDPAALLELAWLMARLPSLATWSHNSHEVSDTIAHLEDIVANEGVASHVGHLPRIIELLK
ncbi:hypothetical protein GGI12_004789, partial [Dipsacomyces acuminosporus]